MSEFVRSIDAVLIVTSRLDRMVAFYRDVLGVPLVEEQHGEAELHYGCEIGNLHFAVHPVGNFPDASGVGAASIRLALGTAYIEKLEKQVVESGAELSFATRDLGWCKMFGLKDPDGNHLEVVQMTSTD